MEWQIPSHRLLIGPRGRSLHQIFLHTYLWFVIFSTLAESVLQKSKKNEKRLGQGGIGPLLKSISSFQFLYWIVINHHSDNKNNQTRSISISVFAVNNNETRSTSTSRPFCSLSNAQCFLGVGGQSPLSTVSADDWVSLYVIIIRYVVINIRCKCNMDICSHQHQILWR